MSVRLIKMALGGTAVTPAGTSAEHSQTRVNQQCSAGVTFASSGVEFAFGSDGDIDAHNLGRWKLGASPVWIRATLDSGTLDGGSAGTGTWLADTSTRSWGILDAVDDSTVETAQITFEFALDSAGTNVVATETYSLSADFA